MTQPDEPAPDEGLVERVKAVIIARLGSGESIESAARAVLAEIDRADNLTPVIETHKKRVAELEAELQGALTRMREIADERNAAHARALDTAETLATVTRERDAHREARKSLADDLAALSSSGQVRTSLGAAVQNKVDSLTRELSEARADYDRERKLLVEQAREAERKEAEAREELGGVEALRTACAEHKARASGCGVMLSPGHVLELLDAHRAKTSDSTGDTVTAAQGEAGRADAPLRSTSELPFETAPRLTKGVSDESLQAQVYRWARDTFGAESSSPRERARRFIEEALELVQVEGIYSRDVLAILDHVYNKPPGDPKSEAGGVGVTLLAYCEAKGFSARQAEADEFSRVSSLPVEHFRKRHNAKAEAGIALPAPVVRVEPEKAPLQATLDRLEANPPRGKVTEADGPLFIPEPHDGGGERSGGMPSPEVRRAIDHFHALGERSGQAWTQEALTPGSHVGIVSAPELGPPRVGDVVANHARTWERTVKRVHDSGECFQLDNDEGWYTEELVVIRRAGQPEANSVLPPIDREDERIVDELMAKRAATLAEKPVTGGPAPHAATVADLVREAELNRECRHRMAERISRLEKTVEEIRAERAGRVKA